MGLSKINVIPIFAKQREFLSAKKFVVRVSISLSLALVFAGSTIGFLPIHVFAADPIAKLVCPTHGFNHVANCSGCGTGNTGGPVGPSPQEIDRQRRQNEANELWKKGDEAWKQRNWGDAIYYNQLAAEKYPEFSGYLENVTKARGNQRRDAEKLERQQRGNKADELAAKGSDAWDRRDWEAAMSFYQQAAEIYPEEPAYLDNVAKARGNQRLDAVEIPRTKACEAASAAWDKKDYPEALRLYLQAQALRNEPVLERNIRSALVEIGRRFPDGVPPRHAGLTERPLPPVGPSDKADALFKLRVEKAFSEQAAYGLQHLKEKSGFVFDAGRVMNPVVLPDVNAPPGRLLEEALAAAKAALVLPRPASERADAPLVVTQNRKLKSYSGQQNKTIAAYERALERQKELFQQGAKATPKDLTKNIADISKLASGIAFTHAMEKAAGGSPLFDPNFVPITH